MSPRTRKVLAVCLMLIGVLAIAIGLLTPEVGSGGMRDMGSRTANYSLTNIALMGVGVALIAIGAWVLLYRGKHEDAVVNVNAPAPAQEAPATPAEPVKVEEKDESISESDYLVLRLLNGDEREMYRSIVDAGGEMLQKDLITKLKWSDAKVSRTIDKLIEKRVVSKERYGSTNRVKVDLTYARE
ncbi:MAG: hypothetical protein A4E32_01168 [Methanomassiliicoccales archaeon PtaU1.Bin124]|nr:MAG: hypothetical protein A4E32_01168 [Methanomassiliicoccales archaeon PtaU1.Bin124]